MKKKKKIEIIQFSMVDTKNSIQKRELSFQFFMKEI